MKNKGMLSKNKQKHDKSIKDRREKTRGIRQNSRVKK